MNNESFYFTKENLDLYLNALSREFRKHNGTKTPAEIILVGGSAILASYGFREMTYDVDAIIRASSAMKTAILHTADKYNIPKDWLNDDFKKTKSYSDKLIEVSEFYKEYSNILSVRIIRGKYLIAMKLRSARTYKRDLSDVVGILSALEKQGSVPDKKEILEAYSYLYGGCALEESSMKFLDMVYEHNNFQDLYKQISDMENDNKSNLLQ